MFLFKIAQMLTDTYKDKGARKRLIEELRSKGIKDERVLAAFENVPRHYFMHSDFRHIAYQDRAFRIGNGQTISQPYTVAYQTQVLHIERGDKVLEIGTGSGFQASILCEMGADLISLERHLPLLKIAYKRIHYLGYEPKLLHTDGSLGYLPEAPYDKIIVTAGAPNIPETLVKQLKIGGIMVIPVGDSKVQQMKTVIKKSEENIEIIALDDFKFVPLIGKQAW